MKKSGLGICVLVEKIKETVRGGRGREPYYTPADALGALLYIKDVGRAGRIAISRVLGLGEQSVRTMLRDLEIMGLVKKSKSGAELSDSSKQLTSGVRVIDLISLPSFLSWPRACIVEVLVDNPGLIEKKILDVRDNVIRWGGLGALILIVEDGVIKAPFVGDEYASIIASELRGLLSARRGVAAVIGYNDEVCKWHPIYGFIEGLCRLELG